MAEVVKPNIPHARVAEQGIPDLEADVGGVHGPGVVGEGREHPRGQRPTPESGLGFADAPALAEADDEGRGEVHAPSLAALRAADDVLTASDCHRPANLEEAAGRIEISPLKTTGFAQAQAAPRM